MFGEELLILTRDQAKGTLVSKAEIVIIFFCIYSLEGFIHNIS